tara:strand:- start:4038 stop:4787 length:750 start_codon:yes stop_codon:yes gene_type:complete
MTNKLHIAIRSYKRAGDVKTIDIFKDATIWIPESQKEDYEKHYTNIQCIPDNEDGNSSRKLNSILNRCEADWILILDDDITDICYWEKGQKYSVSPDEIEDIIKHYFQVAEDLGVKLWGINVNGDPMSYRVYSPISFLSPVLAPFSGHLKTDLRYDEEIPYKEDYDFWLQNIRKYRKTLRVNKYHYMHYHGSGLKGGLVGKRTMEKEKKSVDNMIKKWGSQVFKGTKASGLNKQENILNSQVKVPIKGL